MIDITETEFQAQVVELATMLNWRHLHVRRSIGKGSKWVTATNVVGWPDLLAWRPGQVIAAELKSETGKATDEQTAVLASLNVAGIPAYLWRPSDWDEIARVLAERG